MLEEDRVKAETESAKAPVDFTTLQLHNLMYEKNHYLKAIKACKDFKSKHPDIQLVPKEEFFRDAPEDIKKSVMSNDSAHNLMLKRLNFELLQVRKAALKGWKVKLIIYFHTCTMNALFSDFYVESLPMRAPISPLNRNFLKFNLCYSSSHAT